VDVDTSATSEPNGRHVKSRKCIWGVNHSTVADLRRITMNRRSIAMTAALLVVGLITGIGPAQAKSQPPVTFEASGSFALGVPVQRDEWWTITGAEFEHTCSIPASQGVDGYVVELSDAISAVTSTVLVSGSDATGFGHDFDMYFFDAHCASTGASTNNSTDKRPPGSNYGDERGVFPAGTKYVLVTAGGGPGLEFTLSATEMR
jgi:hypothetical protein